MSTVTNVRPGLCIQCAQYSRLFGLLECSHAGTHIWTLQWNESLDSSSQQPTVLYLFRVRERLRATKSWRGASERTVEAFDPRPPGLHVITVVKILMNTPSLVGAGNSQSTVYLIIAPCLCFSGASLDLVVLLRGNSR